MILVTGASGNVGGKALETLLSGGHAAAGMVRSAERARAFTRGAEARIADYDDPDSLRRAFDGVSTLLFVSSDGDGRDVMRHHAHVIEAAASAKIPSIVFTSIIDVDAASPFYFAPVYRDSERRLRESATRWTILRCGLYAEFVREHWIRPALAGGTLSLPVGTGQVAPLARTDVGFAVAAVAAAPEPHAEKVYELTGPQSLSFTEIARAAGVACNRTIAFSPCAPSDYLQRAWAELDDPWPFAFSTLCRSIEEGRYQRTTGDVERLTGRGPTRFETLLRDDQVGSAATRDGPARSA